MPLHIQYTRISTGEVLVDIADFEDRADNVSFGRGLPALHFGDPTWEPPPLRALQIVHSRTVPGYFAVVWWDARHLPPCEEVITVGDIRVWIRSE